MGRRWIGNTTHCKRKQIVIRHQHFDMPIIQQPTKAHVDLRE